MRVQGGSHEDLACRVSGFGPESIRLRAWEVGFGGVGFTAWAFFWFRGFNSGIGTCADCPC